MKKENPYRPGSKYYDIFETIKSYGQTGISRYELLQCGFNILDITIVLTPREEGKTTGDCRGNVSAQGHIYFVEKLNKRYPGEPQRFRLRWRSKRLTPMKRSLKTEKTIIGQIEQKKVPINKKIRKNTRTKIHS